MFDVLVRLEYKRRVLRRRVLGMFGQSGNNYFVVGVIVLVLGLCMTPILPISLAPLSIVAGYCLFVGGALLLSIVLAPPGLLLL